MGLRDFRRKIVKRIEALGRQLLALHGRRGASHMRIAADAMRRERCNDPAQWHRWYKVNHQRQRRLRALKQSCGIKLNPKAVSLPRWSVP